MLEAVKLPASVAHLNSGLADVDGQTFPHCGLGRLVDSEVWIVFEELH